MNRQRMPRWGWGAMPAALLVASSCRHPAPVVAVTPEEHTNTKQPVPGPATADQPWRCGLAAVTYVSTADQQPQPALFFAPATPAPVPLLVGLHAWSMHCEDARSYGEWCVANGWACILPEFRGPNHRPEATGSEPVVKDILSAVAFARQQTLVDATRIYLVGGSGGGYTSLLMAGRAPTVWAAVSAWVPITDLRAWHAETRAHGGGYAGYASDIEQSCGGPPGTSAAVDREYAQRSPLTHLAAARLPVDISAGIHDGHAGSVPISHALRAFNVLAAASDRLTEADIAHFVTRQEVPPALGRAAADPDYGEKSVLFRRASGQARVTIFEGGHEIIFPAAIRWLAQQRRPTPAPE